ncbi:nuclear pore complex protein Nup214-like protein [Leptotrombidium deliense]|uniref:Nuclear pore complex protein Nup214-like protein n=1 Tax=Leptotrombidium deliense TaxID=299467 RepID=A0A443SHW6_9ACAR|nr:nuclear pore complex protein Nup214-like protein [Leptotrombidium deliense]
MADKDKWTFGQSSGFGFGNPAANPVRNTGFSFGTPATTAPFAGTTSAWPFSQTTSANSAFNFGSVPATTGTANTGFTFGAPTTTTTANTGFAFNTPNTATMSSGFTFGAPTTTSTMPFSGTSSVTPFTQSGTSSTFSFGSAPTTTTNVGFTFNTPTTTTASTGFMLGTPITPSTTTTLLSSAPSLLQSSQALTTNSAFSFGSVPAITTSNTGFPFSASTTVANLFPATSSVLPVVQATTVPSTQAVTVSTTSALKTTASQLTPANVPTTKTVAFTFPQSILTTTTNSSVVTTAAATTTASLLLTTTTAPATTVTSSVSTANNQMSFKQLEDHINIWFNELNQLEMDFQQQAQTINSWDSLLVNNALKITEVNEALERLKSDHTRIDHQLDFIISQQNELDSLLEPLENIKIDSSVLDSATTEREETYSLVEQVNNDLQTIGCDLQTFIKRLNETKSNQDTHDPLSSINKILNSHMDALQYIENQIILLKANLPQN